jgi:hypothetical protein
METYSPQQFDEILSKALKLAEESVSAYPVHYHTIEHFREVLAHGTTIITAYTQLSHKKLPPLHMHEHCVEVTNPTSGFLFSVEAQTLQERQAARRDSIGDRVAACADLVNSSDRPFLVWCNLNAESDALAKAIPDAVEVKGSDSDDHKESAIVGFLDGRRRVMISKPRIAGLGLNLQHCSDMAFVGLSDSYEQLYQAIRRCWRFGQEMPVNVHVITASTEGAVVSNIKRKEREAEETYNNMIEHMKDLNAAALHGGQVRNKSEYRPQASLAIPEWLAS